MTPEFLRINAALEVVNDTVTTILLTKGRKRQERTKRGEST